MRRLIGLLLAGLVLAGCGVHPQGRLEPVETTPSATSPPPVSPPGMARVQVYFLRDGRLDPVTRSVSEATVPAALAVLVAGPTPAEAESGLRTAVTPQPLRVVDLGGATVAIGVTKDFTGVSGNNQLLAVAQVVWTATGAEGVERVRFVLDGEPIEVPTDRGLSWLPVGRGAYRSVSRRHRGEHQRTPRRSPTCWLRGGSAIAANFRSD
jgi:hypothetical protein